MKNIWNKIKEFLLGIPSKYLIGFIFGVLVTAFMVIVCPGAIEWCMAPAVAFCLVCAVVENMKDKPFRWQLWLSVLAGAAVIQLFVIL